MMAAAALLAAGVLLVPASAFVPAVRPPRVPTAAASTPDDAVERAMAAISRLKSLDAAPDFSKPSRGAAIDVEASPLAAVPVVERDPLEMWIDTADIGAIDAWLSLGYVASAYGTAHTSHRAPL